MTETGIRPTGSILDRIIADKREQLEQRKRDQPEEGLLRHVDELSTSSGV